MEIIKIFSEMESGEKLYSVLLSEEEMDLFSEIPNSKAASRAYKEWEKDKTPENARKFMDIWTMEEYIPARKKGIFIDTNPEVVRQASLFGKENQKGKKSWREVERSMTPEQRKIANDPKKSHSQKLKELGESQKSYSLGVFGKLVQIGPRKQK